MDSTDHRPIRTALIPWVFALIALLGLNALAPDHARLRRVDSSDEIGMSPLADNAHLPGRIFNPLVFLAPDPAAKMISLMADSTFLGIEIRRDLPIVRPLRDSVQGRAPPTLQHS